MEDDTIKQMDLSKDNMAPTITNKEEINVNDTLLPSHIFTDHWNKTYGLQHMEEFYKELNLKNIDTLG